MSEKLNIIHNHPVFKNRRKLLRNNKTQVENVLWYYLRGSQVLNCKFRRQHSIGRFIVDFYAPEIRLVIELDGSQHEDNKEYDSERTYILENYNCTVLRFWNNEINNNLSVVLDRIHDEIKKLRNSTTPPRTSAPLLN